MVPSGRPRLLTGSDTSAADRWALLGSYAFVFAVQPSMQWVVTKLQPLVREKLKLPRALTAAAEEDVMRQMGASLRLQLLSQASVTLTALYRTVASGYACYR